MADEQRLTMFLEILAAVGGLQDASDYSCNWINAFCSEHEGSEPDTFNRAHDLGYTTVSHDSDTDHSEVRITQLGRDFLIRPSTPPPPEQLDLARKIADEHCLWHPATKQWQEARNIALATIIETTELAVGWIMSQTNSEDPFGIHEDIAVALRSGEHLKGSSDG